MDYEEMILPGDERMGKLGLTNYGVNQGALFRSVNKIVLKWERANLQKFIEKVLVVSI